MNRAMLKAYCAAYCALDVPADDVLVDPETRERFADEVRRRLGRADLTTPNILRQLLAIRRSGQLPRLRRMKP